MPLGTAPWKRLEDARLLGDFTEDVVKRLFEDSGFHMERFGVEHLFGEHLAEIQEQFEARRDDRVSIEAFDEQQEFTRFLRCFPDFVAIRKEKDARGVREIFPVEVKFRTEREFHDPDRPGEQPMSAIRLSTDSVSLYQEYWPSTLLVVVLYRARTVVATRVKKLRQVPDGRVQARGSGGRDWFFNVESHWFRPLWKFDQGYYDEARCKEAVAQIVAWAGEVTEREHLSVDEDDPANAKNDAGLPAPAQPSG